MRRSWMSDVERAVSCFKNGFNCAQAVLSTYGPSPEFGRKAALRLATPFGAGMARMGDTCGAVMGAFMVIGLKHGKARRDDDDAKEKTYELVHAFVEEFRSRNTSIVCRELVGFDVSTPNGLKRAEEEQVFETLCPNLVQDAAEILEEILDRVSHQATAG
jgi:C_GCAxxG_C_C family probable redox protein